MADLPRKLNLFDGAALLVGATIGSGIFVVPSIIAKKVPEPGLVIFIWAFSGLLVLCGALALAELGAMLPQSGGLYVGMREAYGPFWAFLYGWTVTLVVIPGSIAALCSAFLLYLTHFIPLGLGAQKATGVALLLALAFVNARGAKLGAGVQNVFTLLKVAGIASLLGVALVTGRGDPAHFSPLAPDHLSPGVLSALGVAMIATLFAYDGWHFVGFVAGEIENPGRNLPRSIFVGIALVVLVYLAANIAYIYVLGQPRIAASERVATDAMSAMIGPVGANLISLAILCSIFGALSANILAGPRVFFAMARDGSLFPRLAEVHPRHETPANAIWALAAWAGLLTLTGGYAHLITMSQFANWIFFTMVISSVMVLRHTHPEWPRPYRAFGYPWTVILFALVSSAFVLNTLFESVRSSLLGLGLLVLGVPFYRRAKARVE